MSLFDLLQNEPYQNSIERTRLLPTIQQVNTSSIPGPVPSYAADTPDSARPNLGLLLSLLGSQGGQGGGTGGVGGGGTSGGVFSGGGDNPWGIDVSGNIVTRHGATLDADAIASLRQAAHATGIKPWPYIGGSYRSIAASNALYNQRHDASGNLLPGVLPAAKGGSSMHNYGLAFDQSSSLPSALANYLLGHGWYNGASFGDPPHWSYGRRG